MHSRVLFPMICFALFVTAHSRADEFDLYYLGGQSNMEGFGFVDQLPKPYQGKQKDVFIFHSPAQADQQPVTGVGSWQALRPGHGTGFRATAIENQYSNRFGIELSFAKAIREANPERKIAIIKYARNGSSIAIGAAGNFGCWDPDFVASEGDWKNNNQYDHFLATVRQALSVEDIDGDGRRDKLIPRGILWMQGESDAARTIAIANRYQANLKRLMDLIRASFRHDDLPVVIGRISDSGRSDSGKVWEHGDVVRAAQHAFAQEDGHAAVVTSTDGYQYSDPWHYDTAGYLDLGNRFAQAMMNLSEATAASVENR